MPQEIVVRNSRRLALLLSVLCAIFAGLTFGLALHFHTVGNIFKVVLMLPVAALFAWGVPFGLRMAMDRQVVLVIFRRGLFWPDIHDEVIPWQYVESIRTTTFGPGINVWIVSSDDFEPKLTSHWLARRLLKIGALLGVRGKILSGGPFDHSAGAIVHAIDDWIRYARGQAIKPPRKPTIVEIIIELLGGRA
ncbi:hypothetical protein [Neorhizobium galegae]|uniref:hypothetical protein n=1 Tax=Neorhizobium galegae TaxID=399 RepID=UPI000627F582|nr:hypothetical protein [Neorhizobium galegae]